MRLFLQVIFSLFMVCPLFAQQTEDAVIEISATVDPTTPVVDLSWSTESNTSSVLLIRRERGAVDWFIMLDAQGQAPTSFTDVNVDVGKTYEYAAVQANGTINAFGYISVPIEAPLTDVRGAMLVFVEEALQTPLEKELERLEHDLVGDGWKVIWRPVGTDATVETVKAQIVADYTADPDNVKSVFLFGEIPVPYSGNTAWDGHGNHQGAWAADTYYGDMDGEWTDVTINNTTPSRAANDNVPGDGKFDQSFTPSALELSVGRVDFSNLSETTFGTTQTELLRRYLDKNHNWRARKYIAEKKALVDDNFGYFGGEAFAANAYRNFYPLVGVDNVIDGDFFDSTDDQNFLYGYGCGGGSYTSANGVGNSGNFATDSINVVFSMIFGSYHGDWDSENNPFMMSALASKGSILSCAWGGRPHWFTHPFAAGETLGECGLSTQNSCDNVGYFGSFGTCGVHVTLLGDPSLRAHMVEPIADLTANVSCESVELEWADATAANLIGYHVYRSDDISGDFTRLTSTPITSAKFLDDAPLVGANTYQVRAIVMEETESGFYENASTGRFTSVMHAGDVLPTVTANGGVLSCTNTALDLFATTDASMPMFTWTLPDGTTVDAQTIIAELPGDYNVVVTDEATGCTATTAVTVWQDIEIPSVAPMADGELTCLISAIQLTANPGQNNLDFMWIGPNSYTSTEENPTVTVAGAYELIVTSLNGCSAAASVVVTEDVAVPSASPTADGILGCVNTSVALMANPVESNLTFDWSGAGGYSSNEENPSVNAPGTYELTVTAPNGCSSKSSVDVVIDISDPTASPTVEGEITCTNPTAQLFANPDVDNLTFEWTGPNGFSSTEENPTVSDGGTYNLTITAANGCAGSFSVDVAASGIPSVVVDPAGTLDCSISILTLFATVSTNGNDYEVLWTTFDGNIVSGETTLSPQIDACGTYTITVMDVVNGCSSSASVTVDCDFEIPDLVISGETYISCFGMQTTLEATSSIADATFEWVGLPNPNNPVQMVAAGDYEVIVSAPNGCTHLETLLVTEESEIVIETISTIDCDGSSEFSPIISGGVPPYNVVVTPSGPIPAGSMFTINVIDANGCEASVSGTIATFDPLEVEMAHADETVLGLNDGSATANPSFGTAPYTYQWSNGATTQTISDLTPGVYTVIITDANGCVVEGSVDVMAGIVAVEDVEGLLSLDLYPNPTGGQFQIALALEEALEVSVAIYDPIGKVVWQAPISATKTQHQWRPDLSGFAAGMYFCKMQIGTQTVVKRVVIE